LRKVENDEIDALHVRSIKNSKSLLECPNDHCAQVATFDAKTFNDTLWLKSYLLVRGNRMINFSRQTNRKRQG